MSFENMKKIFENNDWRAIFMSGYITGVFANNSNTGTEEPENFQRRYNCRVLKLEDETSRLNQRLEILDIKISRLNQRLENLDIKISRLTRDLFSKRVLSEPLDDSDSDSDLK